MKHNAKTVGMEFQVDELIYQGKGVVVHAHGGKLTIEDDANAETTTDTPEHREEYIQEAKRLEAEWAIGKRPEDDDE